MGPRSGGAIAPSLPFCLASTRSGNLNFLSSCIVGSRVNIVLGVDGHVQEGTIVLAGLGPWYYVAMFQPVGLTSAAKRMILISGGGGGG
jgi:hypothetical protein